MNCSDGFYTLFGFCDVINQIGVMRLPIFFRAASIVRLPLLQVNWYKRMWIKSTHIYHKKISQPNLSPSHLIQTLYLSHPSTKRYSREEKQRPIWLNPMLKIKYNNFQQQIWFYDVACKMAAMLSQHQCVSSVAISLQDLVGCEWHRPRS